MASTVRPAAINFRLYQHATFSELTTLLDADGDPVDLSAHTARMQVRRERDDPLPIYTLTTGNGGIALGADGSIRIKVAATDTDPLPDLDPEGEVWHHDLMLMHDESGETIVDRLYQGVVVMYPGVTAPA